MKKPKKSLWYITDEFDESSHLIIIARTGEEALSIFDEVYGGTGTHPVAKQLEDKYAVISVDSKLIIE